MDSIDEYVDFYMEKLKSRDFDAAFHGLVEADHSVIPRLIEISQREAAPDIRGDLIRIIWHHRQHSTIQFLGRALSDSSHEVWKSAVSAVSAPP
jgi:hypothetical protein